MKKILITGQGAYIGTSFINYCSKNNVGFEIDEVSVRGEDWKEVDLSKYDTILHVAGIAHQKENDTNYSLYYQVNRDLAYEVAKKAKDDGVKQFILLSTMSVYGLVEGVITQDTPCYPKTAYGKSKREAELEIKKLLDNDFKIAILRPPMVYGPNAKGNYTLLSKFAKYTKLFPKIDNQRSMIYVDNLSEFIKNIIEHQCSGLYFPQDKEYVSTQEMIHKISVLHNNNIWFIPGLKFLITNIPINIIKKIFGDLVYEKDMSEYNFDYQVVNFDDSIQLSEKVG